MKLAAILLRCSCIGAVLVFSCGNPDDDYYGPVDISLLTALSWKIPSSGSTEAVNRYVMVTYNNGADTSLKLLLYISNGNSDTLYKDTSSQFRDTSGHPIPFEYSFSNNTLSSYSPFFPTTEKITKLTPQELVLHHLAYDTYSKYPRNHKTLVSKGTGANLGIDTVDYHE